jgi:molybdopterin-dependent oxidoreductase alpha subunit
VALLFTRTGVVGSQPAFNTKGRRGEEAKRQRPFVPLFACGRGTRLRVWRPGSRFYGSRFCGSRLLLYARSKAFYNKRSELNHTMRCVVPKQRIKHGWTPEHWASLMPFGIGKQRPNNYLELWRALKENRDQLPYAWRILSQGVCDGCALGTTGLHDWTLDGIHLCNIRLRLLRLNTLPALDANILADVASLRLQAPDSAALRALGRIPFPMMRQRGEPGFHRISWGTALELIATRIRETTPDRLGFYLTSRGMPNEAYYAAQKGVRALGTNNIDNAARICHSPSTVALKETLGITATSCSYSDWIGSDLIIFIGANPANNQPLTTKYLHYAKKAGTRVVMVNSYREPGMEHYWVPSVAESALFGTRIADHFFMVDIGGDVAFLNGVMKQLIADNALDWGFVQQHTAGIAELTDALEQQSWEELEQRSGASRSEMAELAGMIWRAKTAIFVWSMGITQHVHGEDGVRAIVNLALSKGFIGRDGCGVMPIRGHSGVQGGAEMGAYATSFPGVRPITADHASWLGEQWGFEVPTEPGMIAPEMIDAAADGRLDLLFASGGNFLEVLPEPEYVQAALERVPMRVHMDIVLSSQMLLDPADTVLLLPAQTRYEIAGGVTETTTERRIIFSPEIAGPRIAEARSECEVFLDLAGTVYPELRQLVRYRGTAALREEIARIVPAYDGIQQLQAAGDQLQYGGRHLCADWQFATADGKAHFSVLLPPPAISGPGQFRVTTRRGKQFNSIVHEPKDAITGARRDAIFICREDAERLGLKPGQAIILRNAMGSYQGSVFLAELRPGNLQVHWPEGNLVLSRDRRSPISGIPDYNALVTIEAADI